MSEEEKEAYFKSQSGIARDKKSLSIKPEDFDVSAGHDISRFLRQNSRLGCRGQELVNICKSILETDPTTKTVVFTDGTIGAGLAARDFLDADGTGCTWLDHQANSVQVSCRSRSLAGFPLTMLQLNRERTRRSLGIRMAMQLKKTGFVLVFSF